MFIKPSKKWRNPEGDSTIMVPYTYYRLCESYREADGKVRQRTVLGLGELTDFPKESQKRELAEQLTSMINDGEGRICFNQKVHDAALAFYGKWLEEKKEAQDRADKLAEEARRNAEEANEVKVSIKLKSLRPEMSHAVGAEHICFDTVKRLGRLDSRFPGVGKNCGISFTYNEKDVATSMTWSRNEDAQTLTCDRCSIRRKKGSRHLCRPSLLNKICVAPRTTSRK